MLKPTDSPILDIKQLSVWFDKFQAVKNVTLAIPHKQIISIMGPSGCGKSTLIRAINRMHDLTLNARVHGKILLHKKPHTLNLLQENPMWVRSQIGMVFQSPNPFPNMTIFENVLAGYILNGIKLLKSQKDELVEITLKKAALWDEVKNKLHDYGFFLSGGQQQRLCIARSLAMKVDILLLDEPTSALDPVASSRIEALIENLKKDISIVMVTHNTAQASRISDYTAFMYLGELIEFNKTSKMFTVPKDPRTEQYLMGKFG